MVGKQYKDQKYLELLGRRIRILREERRWSQEYLSQLCNFDARQLGRIERAETNSSISVLKLISDRLNISLSELFNF